MIILSDRFGHLIFSLCPSQAVAVNCCRCKYSGIGGGLGLQHSTLHLGKHHLGHLPGQKVLGAGGGGFVRGTEGAGGASAFSFSISL